MISFASTTDWHLRPATPAAVDEAAACLRAGGVVAFPTETVYGLGALADCEAAVRRVFAIKGRPADHPLIVHLADADWMDRWARHVPDAAKALARAFWPGPLTLVLERQPHVLDAVTGGQDSVALRVPDHPVARDLIRAAGALVAPSANRFGRVSPTTAQHVLADLGADVDLILDGGPCRHGVESTIVGLLDDPPTLLRPGAIAADRLEAILGRPLARRDAGVRVSGSLPAHYAPATPLELLPAETLWQRLVMLARQGLRPAVLALQTPPAMPPQTQLTILPAEPERYAHALYATLRALDASGCDRILVEAPPATTAWEAVRDRLQRAAYATAAGARGSAGT